MHIRLGEEETKSSSSIRDLLLLMEFMDERHKKEHEKKKETDIKKKTGGGDLLGNAILLTLFQIVSVPCTIWLWGWAMGAAGESLKLLIK